MVKYWKLFESRPQCHARIRNWNNSTMWPLHSTPEADDYYYDVFVISHSRICLLLKHSQSILNEPFQQWHSQYYMQIDCEKENRPFCTRQLLFDNEKELSTRNWLFSQAAMMMMMKTWRRSRGTPAFGIRSRLAYYHKMSENDHSAAYAYVQKRKFHEKKTTVR